MKFITGKDRNQTEGYHMYFLTYHSTPKSDTKEIGDAIGAYINCYILEDNLFQADKIARQEIEEMNWNILTREDAYEVNSESISEDGREYFEQALIDKEVFVFHTYSSDKD